MSKGVSAYEKKMYQKFYRSNDVKGYCWVYSDMLGDTRDDGNIFYEEKGSKYACTVSHHRTNEYNRISDSMKVRQEMKKQSFSIKVGDRVGIYFAMMGDGEENAMFCDNCGKELLGEDAFCPYCGNKVREVNTQKEVFTGTATIQQALEIAAQRANTWHGCCEGEKYLEAEELEETVDTNGLYRYFGIKRGKSYPIVDTNPWPQYIVSREGAIGSIIHDASGSDPDIFWDATTLERAAKNLPKYRKDIIIQ